MSLDIWLTVPPTERTHVFDANITHNLSKMAGEAGIYDCLWRAPERGYKRAWQLIEPLQRALELMKENPERFKKFDAPNGWGTYIDFVPWLERLLAACMVHPEAMIEISR